ncbi:MAG TPA: tail fiber protein [Caulobacteraceae bacterium]|jgi:microcystin-dependent protein
MSNPFLGEVKMFAGNFAPRNFSLCNGQILPIAQFTALFSLLGTNFGGNGSSNFGLPNFEGLSPMSQGTGPGLTQRDVGEFGGTENVTLLLTEIPSHNHSWQVGEEVTAGSGTNAPTTSTYVGEATPSKIYAPLSGSPQMVSLATNMIQAAGSGLPHSNQQPYLVVSFIIAMAGIFPQRN